MSTTEKRKLKRLLRKYLDLSGAPYDFVKVSETDIRNHLGVSSSDWDSLAAYYVKNCLVDRYLGLGHNLYPAPEVFGLDSTQPLVEKFDLFPIADLAGGQIALRLSDGEVFEIASETFTMDYWDGEVDGVHEASLIDYVQTLGLEEEAGYEPTIPDEIRLAYLKAKTEKEISSLSEPEQTNLLITAMGDDDIAFTRHIIEVAGFTPDCRLTSRGNSHFLDFFANRCRSEEMVKLLITDMGFRFHRIEMPCIRFLTRTEVGRALLPAFIRCGGFVRDSSAYDEMCHCLRKMSDPLINELH